MRSAVIDVGTNTIRVLVGEINPGPGAQINVLAGVLAPTRLGEGITGGRLLFEAMERSLLKICEYVELARSYKADNIIIVGTSAVRDSVNGDDFCDMVRSRTGIELKVLSGKEEALYSYLGVHYGLPLQSKEFTVIDVGGGSTEFTWRKKGQIYCSSVKVGAVRATEGHYSEEEILEKLNPVFKQTGSFLKGELAGVGGTVSSMALMLQGVNEYDASKIHGMKISLNQVESMVDRLASKTIEERKSIPGLPPERADIILAGVQIIKCTMTGLNAQNIVVSETGFMHGVLLGLKKQYLSK